MSLRILVADDSQFARTGLRMLIESRPDCEICAEVTDGDQEVLQAIELRPDLVILDFSMPVLDGLHAAQKISKAVPTAQVVICTLFSSRELESEAMKFGVRVISKSEMSRSLLSTLDEISSNSNRVS